MERYDSGFVSRSSHSRGCAGSLTALTQEIHTYLPYRLYALTAYGKKYPQRRRLGDPDPEDPGEYYDYLGWQLPKRRGASSGIPPRQAGGAGHPLSRTRLAAHAAAYALNLVFNPADGDENSSTPGSHVAASPS